MRLYDRKGILDTPARRLGMAESAIQILEGSRGARNIALLLSDWNVLAIQDYHTVNGRLEYAKNEFGKELISKHTK